MTQPVLTNRSIQNPSLAMSSLPSLPSLKFPRRRLDPYIISREELKNISNEKLPALFQSGSDSLKDLIFEEARERLDVIIKRFLKKFFKEGEEEKDLIVEAELGIWRSLRDFKPDKGASFQTFASMCIERSMCTCVKERRGEIPLNRALGERRRCEKRLEKDDVIAEYFARGSSKDDPASIVVSKSHQVELEKRLKERLSHLEMSVFEAFKRGDTYKDIAQELSIETKAVDNALTRVRKKIERIEEELAA